MRPHRGQLGFTLIEMMVTITIIGMAMSAVFGFGQNLLPQARLHASATDVGDAIVKLRTHALFTGRQVVFEYDLDQQGFWAYYPLELDAEDGRVLGPGQTEVLSFTEVRPGMRLDRVSFPGGEERLEGKVSVILSALGRSPAHDALLINPEFPELEIFTVRLDPLLNGYAVLPGLAPFPDLTDADFR